MYVITDNTLTNFRLVKDKKAAENFIAKVLELDKVNLVQHKSRKNLYLLREDPYLRIFNVGHLVG